MQFFLHMGKKILTTKYTTLFSAPEGVRAQRCGDRTGGIPEGAPGAEQGCKDGKDKKVKFSKGYIINLYRFFWLWHPGIFQQLLRITLERKAACLRI
jgi:hypothetical protein